MYSCRMPLTRAGTEDQAAKPKIRKKPMPMPTTHSAPVGTTGISDEPDRAGQQRADDECL